jgi:hypothetical protein
MKHTLSILLAAACAACTTSRADVREAERAEQATVDRGEAQLNAKRYAEAIATFTDALDLMETSYAVCDTRTFGCGDDETYESSRSDALRGVGSSLRALGALTSWSPLPGTREEADALRQLIPSATGRPSSPRGATSRCSRCSPPIQPVRT